MEQVKRYRLIKDLPDAKAGTILTSDDKYDTYDYKSHRTGNPIGTAFYWYKKEFVENNPEWFELIPESKEQLQVPVEVKNVRIMLDLIGGEGGHTYGFDVPKEISKDKFPAIKQAIENALNNIPNPTWGKEAYERLFEQNQQLMRETASIDKLIEISEEKAFNAAREGLSIGIIYPYWEHKYPTFKDYYIANAAKGTSKDNIRPMVSSTDFKGIKSIQLIRANDYEGNRNEQTPPTTDKQDDCAWNLAIYYCLNAINGMYIPHKDTADAIKKDLSKLKKEIK